MKRPMARVLMVSALCVAPLSFAGSAEPAPAVKTPAKPSPAPAAAREITDQDIDMFIKASAEKEAIRQKQGEGFRAFMQSLKSVSLQERYERFMSFRKKQNEEGAALQQAVDAKYPLKFK